MGEGAVSGRALGHLDSASTGLSMTGSLVSSLPEVGGADWVLASEVDIPQGELLCFYLCILCRVSSYMFHFVSCMFHAANGIQVYGRALVNLHCDALLCSSLLAFCRCPHLTGADKTGSTSILQHSMFCLVLCVAAALHAFIIDAH